MVCEGAQGICQLRLWPCKGGMLAGLQKPRAYLASAMHAWADVMAGAGSLAGCWDPSSRQHFPEPEPETINSEPGPSSPRRLECSPAVDPQPAGSPGPAPRFRIPRFMFEPGNLMQKQAAGKHPPRRR